MFSTVRAEKEITKNFHPLYNTIIENTGAPVAALRIRTRIVRESNPVLASVANPYITEMTFSTWENPSAAFKSHENLWKMVMGEERYKRWVTKGHLATSSAIDLLAWIIPLWLETVMSVLATSPLPSQRVLLNLLEMTMAENNLEFNSIFPYRKQAHANSEFVVLLLVGQGFLTQTCHSKETIRNWMNELEAATVLLIPQVLKSVQAQLPPNLLDQMNTAILSLISDWNFMLPSAEQQHKKWSWLPSFEDL